MTRAIRAPRYGEPEVLELVDVEVPGPGDGQVRIAVRAAATNPADLKQLRGQFGRREDALPLRLGSEIAGVVTALGGGVDTVAVGDEVIAYRVSGGYAEALNARASSVFPKPSNLSWGEAAGLLAVGVTAWHLLEATGVGAGDAVLVHGASGGVGLAVVQLALLRGATVVGTAGQGSLARVQRFGATAVEYGPGLVERVRSVLPQGVDVALDTVGTDEALDTSVALVADRDRIATIAAFQRGAELGIHLLGGGPGADPGSAIRDAARARLVELAAEGRYLAPVGRAFPLASAAEALEVLASGHPGGKVVLVP